MTRRTDQPDDGEPGPLTRRPEAGGPGEEPFGSRHRTLPPITPSSSARRPTAAAALDPVRSGGERGRNGWCWRSTSRSRSPASSPPAIIWYANDQLSSRKLVDIAPWRRCETTRPAAGRHDRHRTRRRRRGRAATTVAVTQPTFPPSVDLQAKNYLLTGSDNRSCIDPNSPYAGAFLGEGSDIGERSDTIMLLRVDPASEPGRRALVPRDLWVKIAGTQQEEPDQRGVRHPEPEEADRHDRAQLLRPGRPLHQRRLLRVQGHRRRRRRASACRSSSPPATRTPGSTSTGPECHVFEGDEALAYVRSRHYQYFDPVKNKWVTDGTSDYGRITRQQDFLKRALQKAMDRAARNPLVAKDIIQAAIKNVTTDD